MISLPTIIADERIPFVNEAFSPLGNLITMPGREMNAITIRGADILIVRSITRVDELLIGKSGIQYVATASTGFDHVNTEFLHERGIQFFTAAGCNANSVSEYLVVAIAELCKRYDLRFTDLTIGIIGVGNIGSRVAEKTAAMGMNVLLNDPPLKDDTNEEKYLPLDTVLAESDIVTLHVPLTTKGRYPTGGMVNYDFLAKMKSGSILINTSRGGIQIEDALHKALHSKRLRGAVVDVWCNEPDIDTALLNIVDLGTPHIAGHSIDGQVNASVMVYEDLCAFLKRKADWKPKDLPAPRQPEIQCNEIHSKQEKLIKALLHVYPIVHDDQNLRQIINLPKNQRSSAFDKIRNERYVRREFNCYRVHDNDGEMLNIFTKLGFMT